jgi:hypothetical protein
MKDVINIGVYLTKTVFSLLKKGIHNFEISKMTNYNYPKLIFQEEYILFGNDIGEIVIYKNDLTECYVKKINQHPIISSILFNDCFLSSNRNGEVNFFSLKFED